MFALLLIVKEGCVEYDVLFLFLQYPRIYLNKDFTGYRIKMEYINLCVYGGGGVPRPHLIVMYCVTKSNLNRRCDEDETHKPNNCFHHSP